MTQPAIRGVVFDLDGTLVDSRADIAGATNAALSIHGFPTLSEEEVASYVGDGAKNLMLRAARLRSDSPEFPALFETYLDYYARHACVHTTLMHGAREALAALGHLPLAVLTNKPRSSTDALLDALGIADVFRCVVAGGDLPAIKPDPQPLLEIARRLGHSPATLAMVGDGPQDIECGRAAGAFTVGVEGGIADIARLKAAGPDRLIASLAQLPAVLGSIAA